MDMFKSFVPQILGMKCFQSNRKLIRTENLTKESKYINCNTDKIMNRILC